MADTPPRDLPPLPLRLRTQDRRRTAHQLVRDTLRRAILSGQLGGGARLVQADIAAQLNVSTTPVREALRELATDGLIRFDAHRGGIVNTVDAADFQDIYELRKLLEPYAMRTASARIGATDLATAEQLAVDMERTTDAGVWTELNWRFHRLLVATARSPRLESITAGLQDAATLYVAHSLHHSPRRVAQGNREHRELLAALRLRDADTAARIVLEHLESTSTTFDEVAEPGADGQAG